MSTKQNYRQPQIPKTEAKFLNDSETIVQISNIRNSSKAFFELSKIKGAKALDDFKSVATTNTMTMEVPQGTSPRLLVAIAVKCGMNEAREKMAYSSLKKAVAEGKETTAQKDNYALAYMLNEGVFNLDEISNSFGKKYEAFVKANSDKPQDYEGYKNVLTKCFGAIEDLTNRLKEKGVIKLSEKGNFYLDANDYQKAELVELINTSNVEAGVDEAMKKGLDNLTAYKKAVNDGADFKANAKETSTQDDKAEPQADAVEKPKRTRKAKS